MTDLDPAIWDNPTLGKAAYNERLDRLEKQAHEDRAAKIEGREPREVIVDQTYPGWTPETQPRTGTVPSNYQTVHFADEQQNDIPVDSGPTEETAGGVSEGTPGEAISSQVESPVSDSTQEDGSTQWT